jgi:uncharacterized protein (DUF433 family)
VETPQSAKRPRPRLSIDVPEFVIGSARRTADRYFRGSLSDAVVTALATLNWVVRQRRAGKRVVAVASADLPASFEEAVVPELEEALSNQWTWLVAREHPWRRQLWIKGRRLTAGDLARTAEIEGWDAERVAHEFDLPVEAVDEAQRYLAANRDLVLAEERENQIAAQATPQETAAG